METIRKLADRLIGLSAAIGAIGLLAEVGVILVDVIGRAAGSPLYGSQDMITMSMVIVVFGAMALCDRIGGHVAVDLFERYYPAWLNRGMDIASAALGAVIFFWLASAIWDVVALNARFGISSTTNLLNWPVDWFRRAMIGFCILTGLAMTLRTVELAFRGHDVRTDHEGHR